MYSEHMLLIVSFNYFFKQYIYQQKNPVQNYLKQIMVWTRYVKVFVMKFRCVSKLFGYDLRLI